MRRAGYHAAVRRRLFNLAAGLSLLLCIATAMLWARSSIVVDLFGYSTSPGSKHREYVIDSQGGWVDLVCLPPNAFHRNREGFFAIQGSTKSLARRGLGPFHFEQRQKGDPGFWFVSVADWFLLAMA